MEIAIKSEADSRILIYPLIKTLYNYGTVAVYTSNRAMARLIENELEGGFKNVRIIVSPESDLEGTKEADDYYPGKYDFVIFDNIGAVDYDMLITILTSRLSEAYMQDLLYICADPKTHVLKFGKPAQPLKTEKKTKTSKKNNKNTDEQEEEEDDADFNKWRVDKTDEEVLQDILNDKQAKWIKFPTMEAIELMEGRHYMMAPDDGMIKEFYKLFGEKLSVDIRQFTKGARAKDESSSDVSGADVR